MARRMRADLRRGVPQSRWHVVVKRRPLSEGDLRQWLPDEAGFSLDIASAPSATDEGGPCIDILVLGDGAPLRGAVAVRPIGVLHADHTRLGRTVRHDRPVAVACEANVFAGVDEIADLGESVLAMLTRTWAAYNAAQCASFQVVSIAGAAEAMRLVRQRTSPPATVRQAHGAPPGRGEASADLGVGG